MKLMWMSCALLGTALSLGCWAQDNNGGIKQDTKDAAHSTANAARKTGHKIKTGTKKAVNQGAAETEKGADKVKQKTSPKPSPVPTPQN